MKYVLIRTNIKSLRIKIILLFLIGALLTSCDFVYMYKYQVKNETDTDIKIKFQSYEIDSIHILKPNEKKVIYETDHGVEAAYEPYYDSVSNDFQIFISDYADFFVYKFKWMQCV